MNIPAAAVSAGAVGEGETSEEATVENGEERLGLDEGRKACLV